MNNIESSIKVLLYEINSAITKLNLEKEIMLYLDDHEKFHKSDVMRLFNISRNELHYFLDKRSKNQSILTTIDTDLTKYHAIYCEINKILTNY